VNEGYILKTNGEETYVYSIGDHYTRLKNEKYVLLFLRPAIREDTRPLIILSRFRKIAMNGARNISKACWIITAAIPKPSNIKRIPSFLLLMVAVL